MTAPKLEDGATKDLRERLGEIVRKVWVAWAFSQPSLMLHNLVLWGSLGEADKEVERQIGETLYRIGFEDGRSEAAAEVEAAYQRGRVDEREACAAYCLDRADQYATESGTWVGVADCAEGIAKGDAAEAMRTGENEDLLDRVRRLAGQSRPTPTAAKPGDDT